MANLDGKVAVVTGASSGIGEALAKEGTIVVIAARREERLQDLKQKIEDTGTRAMVVQCDVTDEEQSHELIRKANEEFGHVDILVNNAGVMLLSKVEKSLSNEWRQMFDVNVLGLLYVTDAAIKVMKEQGSGHIVNISSVAGRRSNPMTGVYSGTKYAVNAVSEALRGELVEDGIRVTIVEPGAVATELPDHISDDEAQDQVSGITNIETLEAEDIANAIVYATGQPQRVNVNEILIMPTEQV